MPELSAPARNALATRLGVMTDAIPEGWLALSPHARWALEIRHAPATHRVPRHANRFSGRRASVLAFQAILEAA